MAVMHPAIVGFRDPRGRPRRMTFRLDATSHIPPFEQLRAQLSVMVATGHLEPGTRLPTVRELAAALEVAPGTVARAYRELEHDGVVEGRGRNGTFVVDEPPDSEPLAERRRRVLAAAVTFAFAARQLGVGADAACEAVRLAFEQLADGERAAGTRPAGADT
jgi:DNA-binding transcriptional regulator YhcF (GntR family)